MTDSHIQCVCAGGEGDGLKSVTRFSVGVTNVNIDLYQTIELCNWSMQEGMSYNLLMRHQT